MNQENDPLSVKESFVPPATKNTHRKRTRKVFKAKTKQDVASKPEMSLMGLLCAWIVEHQIGITLNLILLLALVHLFFPRARPLTRKFVEMQYYDPTTKLYGRGSDDGYFVLFWIILFTGLRVFVMEYILTPFARWHGIRSKKGRTRFAEQGWMLLYYSVFWSVGMKLFAESKYWMNLPELWTDFPIVKLDRTVKFYYLVQFSCWIQQLFSVNIEERRKDHWQMFTHHIFTSLLLILSYGYYQTKVGNVVLVIMDLCDILLPAAKMLNYLNYTKACDIAFGIFLVAWFFSRHVAYMLVVRSIITHVPQEMVLGCYSSTSGKLMSSDGGDAVFANVLQPFNDPNGLVCYNSRIQYIFLSLLLGLQVLTLIWFAMVLRVAYTVLTGKNAQDSRSDDEAGESEEELIEDDSEDESLDEKTRISDVESSSSEAVVASSSKGNERATKGRSESPASVSASSSRPRRSGRTTGISLPGNAGKELLGRIGCDKPS